MSDLSMHAHNAHRNGNYLGKNYAGSGLFGLAIVALIVFMVLFFFKPDWVLRKRDCEFTDEVDCMKALLYAVLITLAIAFVLGLLAYATAC